MNIPITVIMRSYNDAHLLPRTLAALDAQEGVDVCLLVFESASTDDSLTIIRSHGATRIIELEPGSYWSSEILNQGCSHAETECVAFLNSDAIMLDAYCLRRLADSLLADASRAGVFARQTVRPDASDLTRLDYSVAFDHRHELGVRNADCLSLVCSMIRRSAWLDEGFDEDLTFAEDWVWSRRQQARGRHIRYVPEAAAEHSHEYTPEQAFRRSFGDAAAMAKEASRPPPSWLHGVAWTLVRRCLRDLWRLWRIGRLRSWWRLPTYRYPLLNGAWHGAMAGWKHFHDGGPGGRQPRA